MRMRRLGEAPRNRRARGPRPDDQHVDDIVRHLESSRIALLLFGVSARNASAPSKYVGD